MWSKVKTADNRKDTRVKRLPTIKGRTWTRRCQWLESPDHPNVKLKFDDGDRYVEILVPPAFAQKVWDRFNQGESIEDSLSFFGIQVPKTQRSRRAE